MKNVKNTEKELDDTIIKALERPERERLREWKHVGNYKGIQ